MDAFNYVEREGIKMVLRYMINISRLNIVIVAKNKAVREQNFEEASRLRTEENVLMEAMPTVVEVEKIIKQLNY